MGALGYGIYFPFVGCARPYGIPDESGVVF
jgi:hypothetical protein